MVLKMRLQIWEVRAAKNGCQIYLVILNPKNLFKALSLKNSNKKPHALRIKVFLFFKTIFLVDNSI